MSECDSGDHPVSVVVFVVVFVIGIVVVVENFFPFSISFLKPLHGFA